MFFLAISEMYKPSTKPTTPNTMTPKEIKDTVLLMMCKSVAAKTSTTVSHRFRKDWQAFGKQFNGIRIQETPAEAVTFASALSDLFIEMAKRLSEAESLQTVAQLMAYIRSARDGDVGIVEESETGTLITFELNDSTPMPDNIDNVYIWDDVSEDFWQFERTVQERRYLVHAWNKVRSRPENTRWTRITAPAVTIKTQGPNNDNQA